MSLARLTQLLIRSLPIILVCLTSLLPLARGEGDNPTTDFDEKLEQLRISCKPYIDKVQRQVINNWHNPKPYQSSKTDVYFGIAHDGQVSKLSVVRSSGNAKIDESALAAVKQTAPFEPLPPECQPPNHIYIQITFGYKYLGDGDQTGGYKHYPAPPGMMTFPHW